MVRGWRGAAACRAVRVFGARQRYTGAVPLYFVRHADAVAERRDLLDGQRYLSPLGRTQARALGERLRWHDCTPAILWSSPLCRALQTAELIAGVLGPDLDLRVLPALAPDGDARVVLAALRDPSAGAVMVVGHEPSLSGLLGTVIGDLGAPALAKAEAVRVDGTAVRWWFAHDDEAPRARAGR